VATVAIAAWEGDIDRERAHAVLDRRAAPSDEDDVAADERAPATGYSAAAPQGLAR
jgi:aerobic C4-dicarboxylate transport protein